MDLMANKFTGSLKFKSNINVTRAPKYFTEFHCEKRIAIILFPANAPSWKINFNQRSSREEAIQFYFHLTINSLVMWYFSPVAHFSENVIKVLSMVWRREWNIQKLCKQQFYGPNWEKLFNECDSLGIFLSLVLFYHEIVE